MRPGFANALSVHFQSKDRHRSRTGRAFFRAAYSVYSHHLRNMLWKSLFFGLLVLLATCQAQDPPTEELGAGAPPGDLDTTTVDPAAILAVEGEITTPAVETATLAEDLTTDPAGNVVTTLLDGGETALSTEAGGSLVITTTSPATVTDIDGSGDTATVTSSDITGPTDTVDTTDTTDTPAVDDEPSTSLSPLAGDAVNASTVPLEEGSNATGGVLPLGGNSSPGAVGNVNAAAGRAGLPGAVLLANPVGPQKSMPSADTEGQWTPVPGHPMDTTLQSFVEAPVVAAAYSDADWSWWTTVSLLAFGLFLFLIILIAMFYVCCCMKERAPSRQARSGDIEAHHAVVPTVVVSKPNTTNQTNITNQKNQTNITNRYGEEPVTSSYAYRETKQTTTTQGGNFPSTPHNSFAVAPFGVNRIDAVEGVEGLENKNFKAYPPFRHDVHPTLPTSEPGFKFITPRHMDNAFAHNVTPPPVYDRRLDFASDPNRVSSRDVITAARVASAVTSVAAAAPPKGPVDSRGNSLERPLLRGDVTTRATSPRNFGTHRTTLLITPAVNRDPSEGVGAGLGGARQGAEQGLTYSDYVGMIRGENSDFAQFSTPDRRSTATPRYPDEENVESQV